METYWSMFFKLAYIKRMPTDNLNIMLKGIVISKTCLGFNRKNYDS